MRNTIEFVCRGVACVLLVWPAAAFSQAFYYEATTTNSAPGIGGGNEVMRVNASVDGDNARVEFVESGGNSMFAEGGYLLTNDAGGTIYMVNPAEQEYMTFDLDALFGLAGNLMGAMGGIMEMSFEDVSSEQLTEQPGGELLGYATTHYAWATAYTMTMRVAGFGRSMRTESTTEVWCTDELSAAGFRVWLRPDRMRTGNAELDELMAAPEELTDCMPLRAVTTSSTQGQGESSSETVVTLLREEPGFEAGLFELPAGYTQTSLTDQLPGGFELPEGVELPEGFPFGR
ncbi:MAG TPA: hypothetical protein VKQ06_01625 [Gammaproteobacteria bacterium]|nr:hypothetical protein [Gammaproteobacteria bacterium]